MTFFHLTPPIKLKLKKDRRRDIRQGYPWIFADCFEELPFAAPGTRAMVKDKDGSLIAFGMYDPKSALAVRVLARDEERLDDALIESRVRRACELRNNIFSSSNTNAYRLINGEGDELPGLVCDRYDKLVVLKTDGDAPAGFWNTESIADWLCNHHGIDTVYERFRNSPGENGKLLRGKLPDARVEILENGLRFEVDVIHGQKTGFFFDQRDNRARIQKLAKNKNVLNLFSYTGGFSVYAGAGGAAHVTSVDLAKPAIEDARKNWNLNGFSEDTHEAYAEDCFQFLEKAKTNRKFWDLIIVDPPSFAHAEKHLSQAAASYEELFVASVQVLSPQGIIALSSCSSHMRAEEFLDICRSAFSKAKRRAQVLGLFGQSEDHPFPLACEELRYLKFNIFQAG
jgi:23S rRNA (cytosine1962-C5)-methyltransferase